MIRTILLIALALCASAVPVRADDPPKPAGSEEPKFEMAQYQFVLLKRGPKFSPEDTPERRRLFEGHMANINAMAKTGKLVLAGPFMDDGDLRGIFIFRVETEAEVRALLANDPAIAAGRLTAEIHPWFGAKNIIVKAHATDP